MSYRPTFAVHAIGRDEPKALEIGIEAMGILTKALTLIDESHLRRFPTETPRLFSKDFNIRYDPLDPPEGSACGDDDWMDTASILDDESPKGPDGEHLADCFPVGTLLLRDDYELVPIEEIEVGDRIWGRDDWTTVEASVYKGILSVDALVMNNGSAVQLTGDHHVFVGRCDRHKGNNDEHGCSCPVDERRIERTPLRDVREYDVLLSPNKIAFGKKSEDPDRAYVEGLYVADGWSCENSRFQISGLDGKRKEEQKREVEAICERLGIPTYWSKKYISVHDQEWTLRVHGMGTWAPEKHVLSLDLDEATAVATLRGVMADSSLNTSSGSTFYTTSKVLGIQLRVLQKMFGKTCSVIYFDGPRKGGFGKLPLWHIGVRDPKSPKKGPKLLRVKDLLRDIAELPCYDIQTSDHYVYLPEHDVTVSNCEDLAAWRAAEANVIYRVGETARPIECPCCTGRGWVYPRVAPYVKLHRDWVRDERGERRRRHLYHVVDKWPEGLARYPNTVERVDGILIEDPSEVLGMGR